MKKRETRSVTRTETFTVETVCDICGIVSKVSITTTDNGWERNKFGNETSVVCIDGVSYPEGGWSNSIHFDICPECFKTKLVPLLKREFNIEPRKEESDW